MKKILCIIISTVLLFAVAGGVYAETTESSALVKQIGDLIVLATPEERQEIMAGLIMYMLLFDGEASLNEAFEKLGTAFSGEFNDNISLNAPAVSADTKEFPIIFSDHGFEVYLTAWKSCNFYGGDIGYEFNITVYNNSNTDYEFGVKKLKANGWNLHDDGTYSSIIRLGAGEKARTTWQVSGIYEKAGLSNLADVKEITGLFFIGNADGWGDEIVSQQLTITNEHISLLECID